MSQATITADILRIKGHAARTGNRATLATVVMSVLAGAALALVGNAAINPNQAVVAADQTARAGSGASAVATDAERSVVQHLLNERRESPSWSQSLNADSVLLRTSPLEAAGWGLPQDAIPVFMQDPILINPEPVDQP